MNAAPPRLGDWMQTFTGRKFWPLDPRADEIDIVDIAHALSMLCRYGGHCLRFYSVAEHCVLMARALPAEHRKWALLHDAAEAYLVDLPRPIKLHIPEYRFLELDVMSRVAERFGLRDHLMPDAVTAADNRILLDEKAQNMATGPMWGLTESEPLGVTLQFWSPSEAERQYLDLWAQLHVKGAA